MLNGVFENLKYEQILTIDHINSPKKITFFKAKMFCIQFKYMYQAFFTNR